MTYNSLLPNGRKYFYDINGNPLSGGLAYYYTPGTTTPVTTYQDSAGTLPNTNPIVLDAAGSCIVFGVGQFREYVTDALGNLISDAVTNSGPISATMVPVVQASTTTAALNLLGVSTAMTPIVSASTVASAFASMAATATAPSLNSIIAAGLITNTPALTFAPTGNAISTLGAFVVQGTTSATVQRQFLGSFNFTSNSGGNSSADKVALYAACDGFSGSSSIWALNTVTAMESGFTATAAAQGAEIDFNNAAAARGTSAGSAGLAAQPLSAGLSISGASSFTSATGLFVAGSSGQWARGISIISCATLSAFSDYSAATTGIEMQANHTGYGVDMNGSTLGGAMRVPNSAVIRARNVGNTADLDMIQINAANCVVLGALTAGIVASQTLYPSVDNSYTLGNPGLRWSSVYAANGTIQTSDASLKTNIAKLPDALGLIAKINPVTFKWKTGGFDVVDVEEIKTVPVEETVDHTIEEVKMIDGKAVKVSVTKSITNPIYDVVPVFSEDGSPVMNGDVQQTHALPRLETKTVNVPKQVEREGKRTHWGFLACDVKAAFDDIGVDFGGYVKTEDGTEALRPDQLIPVLWKALQEQQLMIGELQADVLSMVSKR